ncbi:MAG TPA: FAD/NAD(P)-binding oxidoreductase [Burkholderiaceae bacterium]|nr:FAD/NAD(P)-binding oxidoreductase [Burkholderiaceae bacterium]
MQDPHNTLSRRHVLGAGLAAAVAAPLLGCATTSASGPSIGRVVVIGGGFGGATAARYLRLWANVDVTLVERNDTFISCPISNMVLGGHKTMADITVPYSGLAALGVKRIQGEAAAIDAQGKKVRLADGRELPYDRLIVSPGIDFMLDQVAGLTPAAQEKILHSWKAGPQTVALRRQLEAMRDGGVYALTVPKSPYRCPPGPYERAAMVASYFKQHKPRSKVLLLDANPEIQSKKALFEKVFADEYKGIIEYRPNNELKAVDAATNTAKLEFDDVKADVLNVVPPHRGGDIARSAGLLNMNARWVGVNWLTMESTAVPGIHALGDAVLSAPAMPKSGHMANQHAKVAAAAIIQLLKGEPVNPAPVVMNTCYSFVTGTDVIHVASVHQYDNADKTFKAVPGSGGVSSAPSAMEGRYALSWAQNIWSDMLAG